MRRYNSYLKKGLKLQLVVIPEIGYHCQTCGKLCASKQNLIHHYLNAHIATKDYTCIKCKKKFRRNDNRIRHEKYCSQTNKLKRKISPECEQFNKKLKLHHSDNYTGYGLKNYLKKRKSNYNIQTTKTAFKKAAVTYKIEYGDNTNNLTREIEHSVDAMTSRIKQFRIKNKALKFSMSLHLIFEKATDSSILTIPPVCLTTDQLEMYQNTNLLELLDFVKKQLINQIEIYEQGGSGWIYSKLISLDLTIWKLNPLRASSTFLDLAQWIKNKGAVINIKNDDNMCFKWSVLAALHTPTSKTNKNIISSYQKYEQEYDFTMLKFPVAIKDIIKFETRNKISINVYGLENSLTSNTGTIYPLKVCKNEVINRHVNLLMTERNGISHYSTISQFSRLVGSQYNKNKVKYFHCYSCLHGFKRKKNELKREDCLLLKEHRKRCNTSKPQRIIFPSDEDSILKFKNIEKQLKAPFVVYADVECSLKNTSDFNVKQGVIEEEEKVKEFTYQQHIPVSYSYKIISIVPEFNHKQKLYKGEDAIEHFLDTLQKETSEIFKKYILKTKPLHLTVKEEKQFQYATICHICQQQFKESDIKERDHCHILGHFRGAAHVSCNLNYKIDARRWKMPVFFHNLRGYDGHFIIRAIQKRHGRVHVIPTNMEKYLTFSIGQLRFLDSFQFTMASLENLIETMDDENDFIYTQREFPDEEMFQLIKKKGVFPYDYFDHISKITSTQEIKFPKKESFFNKLNDKQISDKDYLRGELIFNKYCKTFADYHDIYLKTDVLLLADFFEKFRKICLNNYHIDPCNYFSVAGMAFDAALKMTKVELQLLQNEEMYTFFEKGIRGGVSMISKRYAKANNPRCREYDSTKHTTYLIDLDMNNLYGEAMTLSLPTHDFKFLTKEEFREIDNIQNHPDDAEDGFALEVDLEYPKKLHDLHNDYPLASEALEIDEMMLSPLQQEFPKQPPQIKLTPNLRDKTKYIVHYRNLKYYLKMGMRITKIHRVLKFKQRPWLKQYIDYNTNCRANSKSMFEKNFYKLMINSFFGKTQENLRNRVNIEIITNPEIAMKRIAKPSFKRSQIIREDLVIIQNTITTLKLCKPVYIGFSVLDLSKLLMYQFHYDKMLPEYKNKINLCFTDTDSLLYEIQTEDIYKDMNRHSDWYDFSEYPFEHPNYNATNKKCIGKMKDECKGMILEEFIGLRPKCYSLLSRGSVKDNIVEDIDIHQSSTSKGIKQEVKKVHLRHNHYKDALFNLRSIIIKQNIIKSKKHIISTYHITKVALTAFDTKRWIKDDNIHTLAYGHYKTHLPH